VRGLWLRWVTYRHGYGYGRARALGAAVGPRAFRSIAIYTGVIVAAVALTFLVMNVEHWSVTVRLVLVALIGGCFGFIGSVLDARV
jgi:hypothetical protein